MAVNMRSFRKNVAGLLVGQLSRLAIQAAYFVVIARMLGVSGYGAFAAALALIALVSPFSSLGVNTLMVKNVSRRQEDGPSEWRRGLLFTVCGGIVASLAVVALGKIVLPGEVSPWAVLQLAIAELLGLKLVELVGSFWQSMGRSAALIVLPSLLNIMRLGAALIVLFWSEEVVLTDWSTWYICATVPFGLAVSLYTTVRLKAERKEYRLGASEAREGLLYSVSLASQNVYNDIDKTMLASLYSVSSAGVYSAAYRIIDMAYAPIRSIAAAAYPLFFREGEQGLASALRLTRKIAPAAVGIALAAALSTLLVAPLAPAILGADYESAVDIVRLLAPLILLRAASFLAADTLTGAGHQGFRTVAQIGIAVINAALNVLVIPEFGILGAVITTLFCEAILGISLWLRIWAIGSFTPELGRHGSRGRRARREGSETSTDRTAGNR